jgi:hypothetical protein
MGWSNWVWANKYYQEVSMSFNLRPPGDFILRGDFFVHDPNQDLEFQRHA